MSLRNYSIVQTSRPLVYRVRTENDRTLIARAGSGTEPRLTVSIDRKQLVGRVPNDDDPIIKGSKILRDAIVKALTRTHDSRLMRFKRQQVGR